MHKCDGSIVHKQTARLGFETAFDESVNKDLVQYNPSFSVHTFLSFCLSNGLNYGAEFQPLSFT